MGAYINGDYKSEYSGDQIDAAIGKVRNPDSTPTASSDNLVTSGGVKAALDTKQAAIDDLATIRSNATDGKYAYDKIDEGLAKSDLDAGVQASLDKADAAAPQSTTYTKTEVDNALATKAAKNGSGSEDFNAKSVILPTTGSGTGTSQILGANSPIPGRYYLPDSASGGQGYTLATTDMVNQKASKSDLADGTIIPKAAGNLESWESREDSPIESESKALIRTTGGDESINSEGGAKLMGMACIGADFTPSRIISSGFNLLRLQSNNGLAVAVGTGWYFPVPKLTATNDSIGTAKENNGVLFTDANGNNLQPTVRFKALASGVPTSISDGSPATYIDKNGRRHYTTSGPGYLIVSGITWANTCAHLGWSTNYDKYVSPTDANDSGTIVSTSTIGVLRSVGSGSTMISDRADRISDTQMRKTVNVGVSSSLTWADTPDTDSEGQPTGTYTHSAIISGMLSGGVADIKLNGGSTYNALAVDGQTVSFSDTNASVASGYSVKYQLETPTTSNVSVATVFAYINDWGIEYVDATGEGNGLWQYVQGIPDAVYGLLGKREQDNEVIAQVFAWVKAEIDGLKARLNGYGVVARLTSIDALDYKSYGKPMFLQSSTAGAPSASVIPDNWDAEEYGAWTGVPLAPNSFYTDLASKKVYFAPRCTNSTADWIALN